MPLIHGTERLRDSSFLYELLILSTVSILTDDTVRTVRIPDMNHRDNYEPMATIETTIEDRWRRLAQQTLADMGKPSKHLAAMASPANRAAAVVRRMGSSNCV